MTHEYPSLGQKIGLESQIIKKYLFDFSLVLYTSTGIYKGVLGMVILVPFWEIINGQIGHQNNGVEMKFWEFCMILEYFSYH
jgi:uncharacterized membrane protein